MLGTLTWALWEVGLDWWALAPRGDAVFIIGALLLTPWITRALGSRRIDDLAATPRVTPFRSGGLALTGSLVPALLIAGTSLLRDPTALGAASPPTVLATAATGESPAIPPSDWHAYGRTRAGQRYSPLDQITPANVGRLETAWTYRTGDIRGRPAFLSGTLDYFVRAYDVGTGEQLWESRPPAGGQATPMTYTGSDGRQYLLVVASGHGSLSTKAGDYVLAYALRR